MAHESAMCLVQQEGSRQPDRDCHPEVRYPNIMNIQWLASYLEYGREAMHMLGLLTEHTYAQSCPFRHEIYMFTPSFED